jgi:hypothetical protein
LRAASSIAVVQEGFDLAMVTALPNGTEKGPPPPWKLALLMPEQNAAMVVKMFQHCCAKTHPIICRNSKNTCFWFFIRVVLNSNT